METSCPHCQASFNVQDKVNGKTARCAKCKKPFKIMPAEIATPGSEVTEEVKQAVEDHGNLPVSTSTVKAESTIKLHREIASLKEKVQKLETVIAMQVETIGKLQVLRKENATLIEIRDDQRTGIRRLAGMVKQPDRSPASQTDNTPARWSSLRNWRNIKNGMTEKSVTKLLGYPKFKTTSRSKRTYYYSTKEPTVEKGRVKYNEDASIELGRPSGLQKRKVLIIKEPDFSKVKKTQEIRPIKLKPKQRLKKWQIEKNWGKLNGSYSESAILKLLGEPDKKAQVRRGNRLFNIYTYGDEPIMGKVELDVYENKIHSWTEPFWYLLNKEHTNIRRWPVL